MYMPFFASRLILLTCSDQLWQMRWWSRVSFLLKESLPFVLAPLLTFNFWLSALLSIFPLILFARAKLPMKLISLIKQGANCRNTTMTWIINAYQPANEFRQTATDLYWFAKDYYQRCFTFTKQWLKFKSTCSGDSNVQLNNTFNGNSLQKFKPFCHLQMHIIQYFKWKLVEMLTDTNSQLQEDFSCLTSFV